MRVVTLNAVDGGISRLRNKGGAKPTELYDLENGYVTPDGGVASRPGTEEIATALTNTKGLCAFDGELVVFSHEPQTMPAATPTVRCEILRHPNPGGRDPILADIHFAAAFMGSLYVAAEFDDGVLRHYWLQSWGAWTANTVYSLGAVVIPTTANGYGYKATRSGSPAQPWAPNVVRAVGDRVEPTTPNGYYYEVVDVIGANPTSGDTEPEWPAVEDATVIEEVDGAQVQVPPDPEELDPPQVIDPDIEDRYRNIAGAWLRRSP